MSKIKSVPTSNYNIIIEIIIEEMNSFFYKILSEHHNEYQPYYVICIKEPLLQDIGMQILIISLILS